MIPGTFSPHPTRRRFLGQIAGQIAGLGAASLLSAPCVAHAVVPPFTARLFDPRTFGAKGDGQTDDTRALQQTIERCAAAGGGTVILPPRHTFLCGTLVLRSHVELHLAAGSTLLATTDRTAYHAYGSLLFAKDTDDIRISGTGTIVGNDKAFFPPKGPEGYPVPQPFLGPFDPLYPESNRNPPDGRPRMILLVNCRRVLLQDFIIRNSPTWTIHPVGCEDLHITGITIANDLEIPNCDGIDIDHCRNVRISDCNITAGDDCLVLKSDRNLGQYGPCEGITITNCTLESSSAGIKVEPEGPFPLRSVTISNCSIVRSNRGISFLSRDGATVEDLIFSNMTIETRRRTMMWWGSGEPIALSSVPRQRGGPAGLVRNVSFNEILCKGESGIYLRGADKAPLQDISFSNIDLTIARSTNFPGGYYDMRPGDLFGDAGLDRRPTAGLFAANVDGLSLAQVHIHWPAPASPNFGAALELHHCHATTLTAVTGFAAEPNQPASILEDVTPPPAITAPQPPTQGH